VPARVALAALVVAGLALLAGCGGGGKAPSVASLPPSQHGTTTTESTPPVAATGSSGNGRQALSAAIRVPDGSKFSACMRKNGVPNFPDPNAQGVIQFGSADGISLASPKFRAAQQACRKVLPNGGQPTPQQIARAQQTALAFSACMRKHGIKDFPDPTFSGGGIQIRLGGRPGSDLNPQSPLFQKAQTACQALLPGKFGK
jgi:hypothetical protein